MMAEATQGNIIIIGGGLVGSLQALYFAKKNYKVGVYELRGDPRLEKQASGRSINLSLSTRGINALREVGIDEYVISQGIPMYSRMLHTGNGKQTKAPYGGENDSKSYYILSIDRRKLNDILIDFAASESNVTYHFQHKFIRGDFDVGEVTFDDGQGFVCVTADLIIGCDGSYSNVRKQLMRKTRMNYKQEYITHGYKELSMPPSSINDHALANYNLHIWPRDTHMMIALPNQDKTFTCTLFMPFDLFDKLKTKEEILDFFYKQFPDAVPLIGEDRIVEQYLSNPVGDLISIKCSPYHYLDKVVIMGDAAHAMVPFYGQGMNCGFEDVYLLHQLLDKHGKDVKGALEEYSKTRNPDAEAIIDLAMYNYVELRSLVNSNTFFLRKKFDHFLHWLAPSHWDHLYDMTTFTTMAYHEVIQRKTKQDKIMKWILSTTGLTAFTLFGVLLSRTFGNDEAFSHALEPLNNIIEQIKTTVLENGLNATV